MDVFSSCILDLRKSLDEVALGSGSHRVDQEIDDSDFVCNNGFGHCSLVVSVEYKWFSPILLDCIGLLVVSHESEERLIRGQVGCSPSGKKCAAEIARGTRNENPVRHDTECVIGTASVRWSRMSFLRSRRDIYTYDSGDTELWCKYSATTVGGVSGA